MENQNNNSDMGSKTMWMMALCCILPVLFAFLSGTIASKGNWIAIAIMGVFIIGYFILMTKMHKSHKQNSDKSDNSHKHGCH